MLRKWMLSGVVVCLLVTAVSAQAQFKSGDWTLSLGGAGSNSNDFDRSNFSFQGDLGYFFTNNIQVSLRQTVGYADFDEGGSAWSGSTGVAVDYHFDLGRWQPYVGGNVGYLYGDLSDSVFGGPEAGVKFFVNSTTYIDGSVSYEFLSNSDEDDGEFVYRLGVGFRF